MDLPRVDELEEDPRPRLKRRKASANVARFVYDARDAEEEDAEDDGGDDGSLATQAPYNADDEKEEESEDDDQDQDDLEQQEPGGMAAGGGRFTFSGKNFGLTYSQVAEADIKEVFTMLTKLDQVEEIILAKEQHKDGGTHFHCFGSFNKKRKIKNQRFWDITLTSGQVLHPNVKKLKGKAGVGHWKRYCCKEGAFLSTMSVDLSTHKNFEQRMKDFAAWKTYCATPLESIYNNSPESKKGLHLFGADWPQDNERRRNLWIWGKSNIGKTTQVRLALEKWSVFNRVNDKFPYEGYNGEEFVLVDDKPELKKEELIHMLNGALPGRETPVFGETRYRRYLLDIKKPVRFIIISNDPPSYEHQDWFKTRFRTIEVTDRHDDLYDDQAPPKWLYNTN